MPKQDNQSQQTPRSKQPIEQFYAPDRQTWRAWLEAHHATAAGIWLIYYKQQRGKPRVSYDEAVEEALCFGWIDSRPNSIDDERYMQLFSPRKPTSPWSKLNKTRVESLIAAGLMAPAGLAAIEEARRRGTWDAYNDIEALTVPDDLQQALTQNPTAEAYFMAFSATTKKQLLWWLASAKRPETRAKRLTELVAAAAENKNPLAYTPKPKE